MDGSRRADHRRRWRPPNNEPPRTWRSTSRQLTTGLGCPSCDCGGAARHRVLGGDAFLATADSLAQGYRQADLSATVAWYPPGLIWKAQGLSAPRTSLVQSTRSNDRHIGNSSARTGRGFNAPPSLHDQFRRSRTRPRRKGTSFRDTASIQPSPAQVLIARGMRVSSHAGSTIAQHVAYPVAIPRCGRCVA